MQQAESARFRTGERQSVGENLGQASGHAADLQGRSAEARRRGFHADSREFIQERADIAGLDRQVFLDLFLRHGLDANRLVTDHGSGTRGGHDDHLRFQRLVVQLHFERRIAARQHLDATDPGPKPRVDPDRLPADGERELCFSPHIGDRARRAAFDDCAANRRGVVQHAHRDPWAGNGCRSRPGKYGDRDQQPRPYGAVPVR